jgi:hypothetical protein
MWGSLSLVAVAATVGLALGLPEPQGCGGAPPAASDDQSFGEYKVTADYLATPHGLHHRTCVFDVGSDAQIELDGTVTLADSSSFKIPDCLYPPKVPPRTEGVTPTTPTTNGWVEDTYWVSPGWIKEIKANWTVPADPPTKSGQIVFFFPSIEPSVSAPSPIIQPVLQWGVSAAGGGPYWAIASWYCNTAPGVCIHSTLTQVKAGDALYGSVSGSSCTSAGVCTWTTTTKDLTTSVSHVLTAKDTHSFFYAQGGVLEAYNITSCGNYPATTPLEYTNVYLYDSLGHVLTPSWKAGYYNPLPSCNFRATPTTHTSTLNY